MTRTPDRPASRAAAAPRWKPPVGLIALDTLGMLMLAAGLLLQFAPDVPVAQVLPAQAKWPLLAIGGSLTLLCGFLMLRLALAAQRRS